MRASIHSLPVRPAAVSVLGNITLNSILAGIDRLEAVEAAMSEAAPDLQSLRLRLLNELEGEYNRQSIAVRQANLLENLRLANTA